MTDTAQPPTSPPTSSFAMTHCTTCKAGWTRWTKEGGVIVVCLLDREPVWPDMTDCNRYELRQAEAED